MSLSLRRYHESPKNQSSMILTTRNAGSKQKFNAVSSSISFPKNPQVDMKLPSLSRSSMRKSFSTFQSDRNTKFKLTTLEDKLQEIKVNLHNTRQQAKQTIQFTALLKHNLIEKQLNSLHKDMKQQIAGLQNVIKCTSYQNKARSNDLRNDCNQLWDLTQQLKSEIFNLRMRVDQIDCKMGYKQ